MGNERGKINVSVANMYREATYRSEVVNQGLLGESIIIKNKEKDFSQIMLTDVVRIYEKPDFNADTIRDVTIGADIKIIRKKDNWYEIFLPDGSPGWVEERSFSEFPDLTRQNIVQLVKEFLGYPYYWGGRSPKGFDCSGLTQIVFSLYGISLPRDSWMQHRDGLFCSENPKEAQAGDLYFFADNGTKISHVGIALGEGRIIHARGMVRENSLIPGKDKFSEELYNSFVDVRTFF